MQKSKALLLTTILFSTLAFAETAPLEESASPSEPLFDWSKHKGETEVDHPLAEKGLIRISKDKTYFYKVEKSEQKTAVSLKVGYFDPQNLENPETAGQPGATFGENYDSTSNPTLLVDYEWQLWRSPVGKWGIKIGSGLFFAQGNGHFVDTGLGLTPKEVLTFVAFPNSVGAVYRGNVWDKQLLVPYAEGGAIGWTFAEFRDDNKGPKFGVSPAAYFAFGAAFNLTYFDTVSMIQLDREYGINSVYLTGEFRNVIGLSNRFDFSSNLINGGLLMEF